MAVEEVAGTPIEQVCIGSSVNSAYLDLALPGAILASGDGREVHETVTATATPGSRQILVAIAESGVYRQLVEGGVRMLEPVCGPCVGMGQAPPSDANSLRTFNRNFPGRSGTPEDQVYLCSPAVAAVSMLYGEIRDPREEGDPPELLEMPDAAALRRRPPHLRAGARGRGRVDRDPARPEHQDPARAQAARGRAEREDRHRPAGQHLDRRPCARRRDRHVVPLEHPGHRRVHAPAPRPGVSKAHAGVGDGLHRRRRQLRPGLLARARGPGAAAARRARGVRQVVRPHPPPQPRRAGDPRAHIRRRVRLRPREGRGDLDASRM